MTRGHKATKPGVEKIVVGKTKRKRFMRHNIKKKRATGRDNFKCPRCGSNWGYLSKYGLNICRRCFRNIAQELGFKKYR